MSSLFCERVGRTSDYNEATFDNKVITTDNTDGALTGGTNGYMLDATGKKVGEGYTEVEVIENSTEASFVHQKFYIDSDAQVGGQIYPQLFRYLFYDKGQGLIGIDSNFIVM